MSVPPVPLSVPRSDQHRAPTVPPCPPVPQGHAPNFAQNPSSRDRAPVPPPIEGGARAGHGGWGGPPTVISLPGMPTPHDRNRGIPTRCTECGADLNPHNITGICAECRYCMRNDYLIAKQEEADR